MFTQILELAVCLRTSNAGGKKVAGTRIVLTGKVFRLLHRYNLYLGGLTSPQRNVVVHYLVLNRILQRSAVENLHNLSPNEAHLHYSLAEAPVTKDLHNYPFFTRFEI